MRKSSAIADTMRPPINGLMIWASVRRRGPCLPDGVGRSALEAGRFAGAFPVSRCGVVCAWAGPKPRASMSFRDWRARWCMAKVHGAMAGHKKGAPLGALSCGFDVENQSLSSIGKATKRGSPARRTNNKIDVRPASWASATRSSRSEIDVIFCWPASVIRSPARTPFS